MITKSVDVLTGTIETVVIDDDGNMTINETLDVEPILNANKAQYNAGFDRKASMWPVAEIPLVLIEKWKREEGIDVFNKDHMPAVKRKLNSIEYLYLRIGEHQL